ncbi:hypothetical protein H4R34_005155 [Dimargaris verticillata]|uniref:Methyltransferase type 11 domain-containing protein n=1 Tax=Dimargaris verticillata TaxID=2761393 RepID=A0A9W8B3H0_9FUNG|nr:hypothetical protein H4R34_005155 [Dimargaris verticillata]
MASSTDGRDTWQPELYSKHAHFVPALTQSVQGLLKPYLSPKTELLDLGCGDGVLTAELQPQCARVVGIDQSASMVEMAKTSGCQDVRVGDGADLEAAGIPANGFDVVFSNAALHWMKRDPAAVVRQIYRCLKPGGVLVAELGGHLNVAGVHMALRTVVEAHGQSGDQLSPWFFPSTLDYQQLLEHAGFVVKHVEWEPRPTTLPTDLRGWLDTFATPFLKPFSDPDERHRILDEVTAMMKPVACDSQGKWTIMYCRLRVVAEKPH